MCMEYGGFDSAAKAVLSGARKSAIVVFNWASFVRWSKKKSCSWWPVFHFIGMTHWFSQISDWISITISESGGNRLTGGQWYTILTTLERADLQSVTLQKVHLWCSPQCWEMAVMIMVNPDALGAEWHSHCTNPPCSFSFTSHTTAWVEGSTPLSKWPQPNSQFISSTVHAGVPRNVKQVVQPEF